VFRNCFRWSVPEFPEIFKGPATQTPVFHSDPGEIPM